MDEFFKNHPEYKILGINKLWPIIKKNGYDVSKNDVISYLNERNNVLGYKLKPKKYLKVVSMSYTWQVDLMFMNKTNTANIYFVAIEINSRYGFIKKINDKYASTLVKCFEELMKIKSVHNIYKIMGDDDFNNKTLHNFCIANNIKLHTYIAKNIHDYNGAILGYVDRFIRTIKWYNIKLMDANWVKLTKNLLMIVDLYNNSPHSSLLEYYKEGQVDHVLSPSDVFYDIDLLIEIHTDKLNYNNELKKQIFTKFKVGDYVRHMMARPRNEINAKQKIYFSLEVFKIHSINNSGYKLENTSTQIIHPKIFRPSELKKVDKPVDKPVATRPIARPNVKPVARQKANVNNVRNVRTAPDVNNMGNKILSDSITNGVKFQLFEKGVWVTYKVQSIIHTKPSNNYTIELFALQDNKEVGAEKKVLEVVLKGSLYNKRVANGWKLRN